MELKMLFKDKLFWMLGVYVFAAFGFGFRYMNGLILFLGWNIILAGCAALLSYLYVHVRITKKPLIVTLMVLGFFILFFPNTIYVMTDFIHLENYNFFIDYPSVYAFKIMDWVVVLMITWGALLSAKLGITSLERMKPYLYEPVKKYTYPLMAILFIASSVGIYIGRFIRLNSWDFLKIFQVIPTLFENFSFFISFVAIYLVIHVVSYFVFSNASHNGYN
jgi:uncharacterized membrane protein